MKNFARLPLTAVVLSLFGVVLLCWSEGLRAQERAAIAITIIISVHDEPPYLASNCQPRSIIEPSCHSFNVALAEYIELKRRPGDGRIEERFTNNFGSMALAEQPQRLLGIALDDDDVWRLVAVLRQNACTHPLAEFVNLRKIKNVVDDAHDVDDVTVLVGHNSLQQLPRHCFDRVCDLQNDVPLPSVTRGQRRGVAKFTGTVSLPI